MAAQQMYDNHNYKIGEDGVQRCHVCGAPEELQRLTVADERTARAAAHMVHKVRAHLRMTAEEWNA